MTPPAAHRAAHDPILRRLKAVREKRLGDYQAAMLAELRACHRMLTEMTDRVGYFPSADDRLRSIAALLEKIGG